MQPDKNIFRLEHVVEAIEKIETITKILTKEQFLKDWIRQDAVIRNIEVVGEAISSVDEELKTAYPEIPWAEAKGMRNILIHEYFRVDPMEVWITVLESLPKLKEQILDILENLKGTSLE